ncbi:adenylate kinase [Angelakisella massiliensis]|uniref:adenylate kinase n=1 Tax=Angelakisella massiliensis TaxID=1871018 RepID=UPI0024B245AE|nr:adenylate kinase [Angelakisella massiliensis]
MKRILVIGNSGSGKSTFARKLHRATGLPLFHLDLLWHLPDKTNISREEFDTRLEEILALKEWIIDGNYQRTLQQRIAACDTIFLLDYPVEVCLAGVAERIGKERPDMPWQETEFDPEFRQWILDFPNTQLPDIYRLLDQYRDQKQIIIFTSREEADAWEKHYLR